MLGWRASGRVMVRAVDSKAAELTLDELLGELRRRARADDSVRRRLKDVIADLGRGRPGAPPKYPAWTQQLVLSALRDRTWKVAGVELTVDQAREHLAEMYGIPVDTIKGWQRKK